MIIFCQLQIAVYYQKRLIIHQKILCFRKLSLGLEIVPVIITGLIPWLPCDIEKDCIFCFYCMKNVSKLTTEKNTEPAHTLVRFEDLKNALECFKDHQNSKRYKGAATFGSYRSILWWSFSYDESTTGKVKSRRAKISEICNGMYSISLRPEDAYQRIC